MKKSKIITVGLNIGHDGGCAVCIDGKLKVAVAEERITRRNYSHGWLNSLLYCLEAENINIEDVDLFAFSCGGLRLPTGYDGGLSRFGIDTKKIISVDHHLSHAFGAFCMSPFDNALIVVLDALGNENDTESFYLGNNKSITKIGGNNPKRERCKGVGSTYEAFTNFLGFTDQESGKTMALAAYGNPHSWEKPLFDIDGYYVASKLEKTHQDGVKEFSQTFGLNFGEKFPDSKTEIAQNIAAYLQYQTETAVLTIIKELCKEYNINSICLSGGVALNCVINSKIREQLKIDNLFIFPPASDTGQSIGNALYAYYYLAKEIPRHNPENFFFGKKYTDVDITEALNRTPHITPFGKLHSHSFAYSKESNIEAVVAQLIKEGFTIGWYQGGCELGPRALGHRSILSDPRMASMREKLNTRVKFREWFRPFAPSILEEEVEVFFETKSPSPFMLESPLVKKEKLDIIPAAVHIDGSARLQTVSEKQDSKFYKLIKEFYKITGVPVLLNTSFNSREPIVETPADALFTFLCTELDYLVLDDYLVHKTDSK